MRQLVSEREHLRRLRVRTVHEDQRRIGIGEREAAKLLHAQPARGVVTHHTIDHRHHAELLDRATQLARRGLPSVDCHRPSTIKAKRPSHLATHSVRLIGKRGACHEGQRFHLVLEEGLPQPLLSALHRVERVEQIRARPASGSARHGAIIRHREAFVGGLGEETGSRAAYG